MHHYILFDTQTQELTEPFYGPKKPNGPQRKYWVPWKELQHLRNGPRWQGFLIGILGVGSKGRQTRDSCLGAERNRGRQSSRYGKRIAVEVAQFWLLKTLVVCVLKNVHIIDRKATKGLLRYNRPVDGATYRLLINDRLMPLLGSSWWKTNLSLSPREEFCKTMHDTWSMRHALTYRL